MALPARVGGSFAPSITSKKLDEYRELAQGASEPIKDAMLKLCEMVEVFSETPRSKLKGEKHPSGIGIAVPLEPEEIQRIWELVPWDYEIQGLIGGITKDNTYVLGLFDSLPVGEKGSEDNNRRNAAYHLAWYGVELSKDREPMTTDTL